MLSLLHKGFNSTFIEYPVSPSPNNLQSSRRDISTRVTTKQGKNILFLQTLSFCHHLMFNQIPFSFIKELTGNSLRLKSPCPLKCINNVMN